MNINFSIMEQLVIAPLKTKPVNPLTGDWVEEYEERAAILEYDGGLDRIMAEQQAYEEISKRMEAMTNNNAA